MEKEERRIILRRAAIKNNDRYKHGKHTPPQTWVRVIQFGKLSEKIQKIYYNWSVKYGDHSNNPQCDIRLDER